MMKSNKKLASIVAGILFLVGAALCVTRVIPLLIDRSWVSTYERATIQLTLIIDASGILLLPLMGLLALRHKKSQKLVTLLQAAYMGMIVPINIMLKEDYVLPAILFAALILSKVERGDPNSEAAKVQAQTEKQTSIYDKQLKDGILTQEEYDQITKNMQ